MSKILQWVLAATLLCGTGMVMSCSESDDNPVEPQPPMSGMPNADRLAFEAEFSNALASSVREVRFEAIGQTLETLNTFFSSIDGEQLNEQVSAIFPQLISSMEIVDMSQLDEATLKQVAVCLNERFGMTPTELALLGTFFTIDASKALGTRKISFKDGKASQSESDGFVLEYVYAQGGTSNITMQFKQEADGVSLFVARLFETIPVCVLLPKVIDVSVTSPTGLKVNGTIDMSTTAASNYMAFRNGQWLGRVVLTAGFQTATRR